MAGWNKPEYEALGLTLPDDHETRYGYAQEWFDIVQKLWTSEEYFDWNGKYFNLKHVAGDPKPINGRPPILNAAGSEIGRAFATDNADYLFTPAIDLTRSVDEIKELKEQKQKTLNIKLKMVILQQLTFLVKLMMSLLKIYALWLFKMIKSPYLTQVRV